MLGPGFASIRRIGAGLIAAPQGSGLGTIISFSYPYITPCVISVGFSISHYIMTSSPLCRRRLVVYELQYQLCVVTDPNYPSPSGSLSRRKVISRSFFFFCISLLYTVSSPSGVSVGRSSTSFRSF